MFILYLVSNRPSFLCYLQVSLNITYVFFPSGRLKMFQKEEYAQPHFDVTGSLDEEIVQREVPEKRACIFRSSQWYPAAHLCV